MKHFILLFVISIFTINILKAQSPMVIYLGDDMNSRYITAPTSVETENGFTYRHFSGYDRFINRTTNNEINGKISRSGILLPGETTTTYTATGEIVTGTDEDSVVISYMESKQVIHHGRSATFSVLNAFAKKKDKLRQQPYDEIRNGILQGNIRCGNELSPFTGNWLQWRTDTVWVTGVKEKRKIKNGKIKKAAGNEGLQLMKESTCLAAIDYFYKPQKYYLAKELSDKEKLIIVSYLQVRELSMTLEK